MTEKTDLKLLARALAFASLKHKNHKRKDCDKTPYINHPIALMNLLVNGAGITDPEILSAALLHDTVEDTNATFEELTEAFGEPIAGIVEEVTDDNTLPKAERILALIDRAPHLSTEAKAVKLADKICNLRDVIESPPHGWPLERRKEYFALGEKVIDELRGEWPVLEGIFDTRYKRRAPTLPRLFNI